MAETGWVDAREFSVRYTDAQDYAIGWASPTKFFVFFTAIETIGEAAGERYLFRFQGNWSGSALTWEGNASAPLITRLGPALGSIRKVLRTEDGSFAVYTTAGTSE